VALVRSKPLVLLYALPYFTFRVIVARLLLFLVENVLV